MIRYYSEGAEFNTLHATTFSPTVKACLFSVGLYHPEYGNFISQRVGQGVLNENSPPKRRNFFCIHLIRCATLRFFYISYSMFISRMVTYS